MRYVARWDNKAIVTDDYDLKEVLNRKHLKNICKDLIQQNITCPVWVYDERQNFITVLTQHTFTPVELLV